MKVKEIAPAKINLYLDVVGKREDGFHNIETLMQSITLADEVEIEYFDDNLGNVAFSIVGNDTLLLDDSNLVIRAVKSYKEKYSFTGSLAITLNKSIPVCAGLAGGSTDAAATLRALNRIFNYPLSIDELFSIGLSLGSDVPFCILGGTALCRSRGEDITPLDIDIPLCLVVAKTNESVSTPMAYKLIDDVYGDFKISRSSDDRKLVLESLLNGKCDKLYNIFEPHVLEQCEKSKCVFKKLNDLGASAVLMSGSGPSIFGIFNNKKTAQEAVNDLRQEVDFVCYAENIKHKCKQ